MSASARRSTARHSLKAKIMIRRRLPLMMIGAAIVAATAACSGNNVDYTYPEKTGKQSYDSDPSTRRYNGSVFGADGLNLFGSSKNEGEGSGGIVVNSYLWRASLDSI